MKINEFHDLSDEALAAKITELRDESFKLRFRHSTGELENTSRLKGVRQDLARALTVLQQRQSKDTVVN